MVCENQKKQPLWLVLHRRCRDRPVIQHIPNRNSKVLPYFVKLTTEFDARGQSRAIQSIPVLCLHTYLTNFRVIADAAEPEATERSQQI